MKPTSLGPSLQWDTNKKRIERGMKPYPGPRPKRVIRIVRRKK